MTDQITKAVQAIASDILRLSHAVLANNGIGTNPKTGVNTLKESLLAKDMKVEIRSLDNPIVIETLFDNYIDYIDRGRKPRQGKQPPIDALRDWALMHGIPTDNSTLFLISRAIWRDGQAARPILATLDEAIAREFERKWADMLFEATTEELNKYFE